MAEMLLTVPNVLSGSRSGLNVSRVAETVENEGRRQKRRETVDDHGQIIDLRYFKLPNSKWAEA